MFIDYQNVYKRVRGAFDPTGVQPATFGQIHPEKLGQRLAGADRRLVAVRVYRGLPSPKHDPRASGAADRQVAAWQKLPLVTPITRPLNYRDRGNPREKGIDVALAVDFVMMAQRKEFDVGVLVSADTDLLPALEAVLGLLGDGSCEVGCWISQEGHAQVLRLRGRSMRVHGFYEADYRGFEDTTDYNVSRRRR